ncbi:MAG TPA: 16S rRNA (guanine(966)-N(2))-methyltransferase RsmD [Arachnia sp.]|nr:16S rRNA (guanine(966)-N(2))-methyltransferase RsmD [Arachnia sp.]
MSRIIAGRAKGHRLSTPKGARTRPTTDRTREALFSALSSWFNSADADASAHLAGVSVLDLFAGSGAVGLEAASRGASPVVLVEQDRPTARLIQDNARATGLSVEVVAARAEAVAGAPGRAFDLIFLDPPYEMATESIEILLEKLAVTALAGRGLVVVERSSRDRDPSWPPRYTDTWLRRYGETTLHFGAVD